MKELLRPCSVRTNKKQVQALFHCWEQYSEVLCPSPLLGGHTGGQLSCMLAIVELQNGEIIKVKPTQITFTDCEVN